eukprot:10625744-Alexandrium_andersonii.AAC.1
MVLLQETHWRPAIAPIWEAIFTDASVCYSAARRGPQGGWQGGVAIVAPRPAEIRASRVLVEGIAVLATVASGPSADAPTRDIVSLYLPPAHRRAAI